LQLIERVKVACDELVRFYTGKILDALVRNTRRALEELVSRILPTLFDRDQEGDKRKHYQN
jgi:hypothetical protein